MNKKEIKIRKEIEINKKSARRNYSNQTGITLIALVVTIVVLLILAGVSLNAIFSENGIIKRAQEAQNKMDEAQQKDLNSINELNNWLDNNVSGTAGEDTPSQKKIISFTIANTNYQAEEGMTWKEWVESQYNNDGYICLGDVVQGHGTVCYNGKTVSLSEQIKSNTAYTMSNPSGGN